MVVTIENIEKIKQDLSIELMLIEDKYYDKLNEIEMGMLKNELERKIVKMMPAYKGTLEPSEVFEDALFKTASHFVKNILKK